MLLSDELERVKGSNAIAVRAVCGRDVTSVIACGEVGPYALIDSVEQARAIHEREARNFGQVDLGQLGVELDQLSLIRGQRDLVDDSISFIVYIYLVEQKKGCSLISDRIYLKAADSVFLYKASSAYAVYNETGIIDCERQQQ